MRPDPGPGSRARALGAMFAAAVLFSLMGACTKAATQAGEGAAPLPGSELAFFRYLFGLLFLLALRAARGVDLLGADRRGLLWRGVFGGIASVSFFLAIEHTSLTHATLLNYTSVIWGPLLAVYSLGERLHRRGALALLAAIGGVLLVTRPELGQVRAGDAVALLSGIFAGMTVVQIRRLRQGESSYTVFFYFNLVGLPLSVLALLLTRERFLAPAPGQWLLLLAIGATSVSAQLLMTYGYREVTAAQGSLITLTSVVFAALFAHTLFGEALPPTTLLGGALILLAAATLVLAASGQRSGARR